MKIQIALKDKIKMYLQGLKLKPRRMMGDNGKYIWIIASSHPLYSVTWTWAIYWIKPSCWKFESYDYLNNKHEYNFRKGYYLKRLLFLGFSLERQEAVLRK
jgi:hypothetical protein